MNDTKQKISIKHIISKKKLNNRIVRLFCLVLAYIICIRLVLILIVQDENIKT